MNPKKVLLLLLEKRLFKIVFKEMKRRLFSNEITYIVRKDSNLPWKSPESKIIVRFRPIRSEDVPVLLDIQKDKMSSEEAWDRIRRLFLLESKISKCYVAITTDGRPCHLHWFIGPEENDRLKSHFNSGFPKIADDEMLLEGGYTHPEFRGLGLLAVAMDQIPKIGKRRNTRWILGFIRENNGASLKGSKRAGFVPYMLRNEKWRCFRRSLEYVMVPKNAVFPFEE